MKAKRSPELLRKIFELSLTYGTRKSSEILAREGIKIHPRVISDILARKYDDSIVPIELQDLSIEARKKRKVFENSSPKKYKELFKMLRRALIGYIMENRELKKRISQLELELEKYYNQNREYLSDGGW